MHKIHLYSVLRTRRFSKDLRHSNYNNKVKVVKVSFFLDTPRVYTFC
jgi:hypothetical protein